MDYKKEEKKREFWRLYEDYPSEAFASVMSGQKSGREAWPIENDHFIAHVDAAAGYDTTAQEYAQKLIKQFTENHAELVSLYKRVAREAEDDELMQIPADLGVDICHAQEALAETCSNAGYTQIEDIIDANNRALMAMARAYKDKKGYSK